MGDDTWMSVFPDAFEPNMTFPYDSFNVEDLHTVDQGVITHLFPLLEDSAKPFDFLIGHFLGVDHVGHRVGPDHPTMKAKLTQMNDVLKRVVDLLDDDTLLIVLGDHGMDHSGDHGGDGVLETSAGLWVYSKGPPLTQTHLPPSGLLRYTTYPGTSVSHRTIQQIDILPTLSLILGLPIPFNNLGTVIPELFWRDKTGTQLAKALEINALQVKTYLTTYRSSSYGGELENSWQAIESAWEAAEALSSTGEMKLIALSNFIRIALGSCRSIWAQFNPLLMGLGLAVLGVGLVATWSIYSGLSDRKINWDRWMTERLSVCVRGLAGGAVIGFVAYLMAAHLSGLDALDCVIFAAALLSSIALIVSCPPRITLQTLKTTPILLVLHALAFFSNSFTFWEDRIVPFFLVSSIIPSVLTGFTAPVARLRSRILGFSLLFALCVRLMAISTVCREEQHPYCHATFYTSYAYSPLLLSMATLIAVCLPWIITRIMRITRSDAGVARSSLSRVLAIALSMGTDFWGIELIESILGWGNEWSPLFRLSRTELAESVIGSGNEWSPLFRLSRIKLAESVVGSGNEWSPLFRLSRAELAEFVFSWGNEWSPLFRLSRTWIARLAFGVVFYGSTVWWSDPICLDIEIKDPQPGGERQVNIMGYANVFGSSYFVFWTMGLGMVYLTTQLTGQVVLALATVALLSYLEVLDSVRDAKSIEATFASSTPSALLLSKPTATSPQIQFAEVVPVALLGIHAFFGTGHQATVSSIQWKSAFMLTPHLMYPFAPMTVVINSVGPLFLMGLAVPLVALWNRAPIRSTVTAASTPAPASTEKADETSAEAIKPDSQIKRESTLAALGFMAYFATLLLGTAISAAILRRHLMVWKVFAPRFMLAVLGVLVADVAVLIGVGIGVERIARKIGRMFTDGLEIGGRFKIRLDP